MSLDSLQKQIREAIMISLVQNPEFGNNSENFHPCIATSISGAGLNKVRSNK